MFSSCGEQICVIAPKIGMDEHTEQVLCDLAEFIMEKMPMSEQELFKLVAPYKLTGDQPEAIAKLVEGIKRGG